MINGRAQPHALAREVSVGLSSGVQRSGARRWGASALTVSLFRCRV